ncbi:MAG TPA: glycosyltransferase family 2 protein [Polyangiaceae bacterium]|nr:glycosyltransferase family 2 protein [Polyangiaceae bacterium]
MWLGSRIVVIVPAWNEAPRILRVLSTVPSWVDAIVVVDDASTDGTSRQAGLTVDPRIEIVRHGYNRGVGAAIVSGYRRALAMPGGGTDAFVVMAGDGQMDPADLPSLVSPVARGEADYVKGTRFRTPGVVRVMPPARLVAGLVLSWATSRAIGVSISDSQCGYTALARRACARLDLDAVWPRYGYPNDLLSQLALRGMKIAESPVRAIYADEVSRLRPRHVPRIAGIIARAWARRVLMPLYAMERRS